MSARWTTDRVLALAPDAASHRAASKLTGPASWPQSGITGGLLWGRCAGSGQQPYQTAVDLDGPAYRCTCPSRKFPCKHALALLLNWVDGLVPDQPEAAEFARGWQAGRTARAAAAVPKPRRDPAAAARRSAERTQRVSTGLAELQTWLRDQVRAGLSGAGTAGYRHGHDMAARMVDAQAPGVAGALRRLSAVPLSGAGWPGRLLAEYAQLHLLARAHAHLDQLPPALQAVVRARVGYPVSREEVLAGPGVTDRWLVLGVRDVADEPVAARRVWLRGRTTGRFALLLSFAAAGNFGLNPDAMLTPGTALPADLHYYPGQPAVRAVTGTRHGDPEAAGPPAAAADVLGLFGSWAAALELDPWLAEWPAVLTGTPVTADDQWHLADAAGNAVPLLGQDDRWTLLAISGGRPVTVAGEWSPAGLLPLTVWHQGRAVRL